MEQTQGGKSPTGAKVIGGKSPTGAKVLWGECPRGQKSSVVNVQGANVRGGFRRVNVQRAKVLEPGIWIR